MLKEAWINERGGARVGISQGDVAPALRAQDADVARVAVAHAEAQVKAMVIQARCGQVKLQIRDRFFRT